MIIVLVIGGVGFIGYYLFQCFFDIGIEVLILDDFFLVSLLGLLEGVIFYKGSVVDLLFFVDGVFDVIYYLVFFVLLFCYLVNLIGMLCIGVEGIWQMLDRVVVDGVIFLFVFIFEIYGDLLQYLQFEFYFGNVDVILLRLVYDEVKRFVEVFIYVYQWLGVVFRVRVVRIFNIYGLGMVLDDGRVVFNFIIQVFVGELLIVYGEGS